MRSVDDAVLAALRATGLTVHDGEPPAGSDPNVVVSSVPFASLYSNLGDLGSPRLSGRNTRTDVEFQVTYVGVDRTQAKWAGEKVRGALADKRLTVPGSRTWLVSLVESRRVVPDVSAKLSDGRRLLFGVDVYTLSVTV